MSFLNQLYTGSIKHILCAVLGVAALIGVAVGVRGWHGITTPVELPDSSVEFSIASGESFSRVVRRLEEKDYLSHGFFLKLYARFTGKASRIKAGEFQLDGPISAIGILEVFVSGRVRQHQLAIVEGWTFKQLRTSLQQAGDTLDVRSSEMSPEELMTAIGFPGVHPEGQFMPDTYSFPRGTTDIDFLRRAYVAMQDYLTSAWENREEGLAIETPYEALILASIVEKETAAAEERPQIAGVFMSRLRLNMRLQTDPTIIYGLGDSFDGNIRRKHLRQDTPYNTYTRHGLTPTPIAMPGRAAIDAVLHPAETKALYFVSRGDGTHKFSKTLQEHEAAVDKYQRKRTSN